MYSNNLLWEMVWFLKNPNLETIIIIVKIWQCPLPCLSSYISLQNECSSTFSRIMGTDADDTKTTSIWSLLHGVHWFIANMLFLIFVIACHMCFIMEAASNSKYSTICTRSWGPVSLSFDFFTWHLGVNYSNKWNAVGWANSLLEIGTVITLKTMHSLANALVNYF